jgi:membrane associated rhomboid family serine protease
MATCYRHPGRETNVSCSNCGRPICPDCMTSTPVGMRCPECARQKTQVRHSQGMASRSDAPATYVLIGLCVAAYVVEVAGGSGGLRGATGSISVDFGLFAAGVADGEPYRIITSAFLHAGIFHLAINMFALYILGTILEPAVGTARFVGIYLASILAGSFGALLLSPDVLTVGASGGVFGLMAATFLIARQRGLDQLASQIGFFVILNLVFTFGANNISVGGHLGGLIGGALAGLLVTMVGQRRAANSNALVAAGLIALCVIAAAAALITAEAQTPSLG